MMLMNKSADADADAGAGADAGATAVVPLDLCQHHVQLIGFSLSRFGSSIFGVHPVLRIPC